VQFVDARIGHCRQHGDGELVGLVDRHSDSANQAIPCAGFCVCIHGVCIHGGYVIGRVARLLAGVLDPRRREAIQRVLAVRNPNYRLRWSRNEPVSARRPRLCAGWGGGR
jgi:hypothetical protein